MKKCSKCKKVKSPSSFRKDSSKKDGLAPSCKACKNNVDKSYRDANSSKISQYRRSYYVLNKNTELSNIKKYAEANRNIIRAISSRRRGRIKSAQLDKQDRLLAASYRLAIKEDPCYYCGASGEHDDHYYPIAKGGSDYWYNLVRACSTCNSKKWARCGTWFMLSGRAANEAT